MQPKKLYNNMKSQHKPSNVYFTSLGDDGKGFQKLGLGFDWINSSGITFGFHEKCEKIVNIVVISFSERVLNLP